MSTEALEECKQVEPMHAASKTLDDADAEIDMSDGDEKAVHVEVEAETAHACLKPSANLLAGAADGKRHVEADSEETDENAEGMRGTQANDDAQRIGQESEASGTVQELDTHLQTELEEPEGARADAPSKQPLESGVVDSVTKAGMPAPSYEDDAQDDPKVVDGSADGGRDIDSEGASTCVAQFDIDATSSNSDCTAVEPENSVGEEAARQDCTPTPIAQRVLHVQAAMPQDLSYVAPTGCVPGQALTVQGPHGPLQVQAPPDVQPGQRVTMRLGSPWQHEVFVPAGAKPGQKVTFFRANDEKLEAVVPPGKRPGQVFHVSPPVVMIPVPLGAVVGDQLAFVAPNGKVMMVPVPPEVPHGQYISVQY